MGKIKEIYKRINKNVLGILICGAIGAIIFLLIYGIDKIDVTNEKWLLTGGDLQQHYLGWKFFRSSPWQFPIGEMSNINYPFHASVIFTDSIPLFAIIFKVLSPILPETFQYFGIYGIIAFTLQGIFSYLLIHRFVDNKKYCIIGSIFFIVSPVVLQRMYGHTALAGHFIILMALCLWVYNNKLSKKIKLKSTLWILLCLLAVTVHLYFLPMVLIIMTITFINDFIKDKSTLLKSILILLLSCLLSVITIYALGGFPSENLGYTSGGVGYFSSNLNTFCNPTNVKDSILSNKAIFGGQEEGFGYLGFGILSLLGILIYNFFSNKGKIDKIKNEYSITSIILIVISIIIATALNFTLDDKTILNIKLPTIIVKIISIFRSTGRFIWTADYIFMMVALVSFYKYWNNKTKKGNYILYMFIVMCLCIQIFDLRNYLTAKHNDFQKYKQEENIISNEYVSIFSKYEHVIFLPASNVISKMEKMYYFANIAIESKCTINNFYFARSYEDTLNYSDETINELCEGKTKDNSIYVIIDEELTQKLQEKNQNLFYYTINETTVAFPQPVNI